jgi:hypothetical protein
MKKMLLSLVSVLLLSGCAITSSFTVDSNGQVSGTSTFSVPKSTLRNVTTVEQWAQVLTQNNAPTPGATPQESSSASPSASCEPGEDTQNSEWTYTCTATGDLSILNDSSTSSGIGNLLFTRDGTTITMTQSPNSVGEGEGNPLGIKGVSYLFTSTTISFPGDVETVTGGATKVDQHTVTFTSDENQQAAMGATVSIPDLKSTATNVSLAVQTAANANGGADVLLTAKLDSAVPGEVLFFDGDTGAGQQTVDSLGQASTVTSALNGAHNYSAKFIPTDWWNFDQSRAQQSVTIQTFAVGTKPKIVGKAKVGAKLSVVAAKSTPTATKVSYQWLRNGAVIKGKTGNKYTVTSADYKKSLSVKVSLSKSGVIPAVTYSKAVKVLLK